jgi:hypothetical protein
MPVSLGGDPFLIECICKGCNSIKGAVSSEVFQRFMQFLYSISPEEKGDFIKRLHAGAYGIRMMVQAAGRNYGKRNKTDPKPEPVGEIS